MAILYWGVGLFVVALCLHLFVWRVHKPQSPIKVLLAIFLGVVVVGLAALYFGAGLAHSIGLADLATMAAYLHVLVFFLALAFSYIVAYTVLEWDSPTLAIVTMIARTGALGLEEAELLERAERLPFLESRMQDLIRSGILVEREGRYLLSTRPHLFFRSILLYSSMLQRDKGSG